MDSIGNSLSKSLARLGLRNQAESARVCALAESISGGDWGAISFKDGVLKIKVISNDQAYLLKLTSDKIIAKINNAAGGQKVKKLAFKVDR